MPAVSKRELSRVYKLLYKRFGPQEWWPGQTRFEIIVGAILTQNTNWGNVEKAILNLKKAKVLHPQSLKGLTQARLAALIKPAGYFNVKAKRLKHFIDFLFHHYQGRIERMRKVPLEQLRCELLAVNGIGPETADSILLYALDKPVFVIDAYTKRFMSRHGWVEENAGYVHLQDLFHTCFKRDVPFYNEFHAQIVMLGKHYCKPTPRCEHCPLECLLPKRH